MSHGLTNTDVRAFAVCDNHLHTATWGSGVWKRPLSELITSSISQPVDKPFNFSFKQNYPNPFNSETLFRYELPKTSRVQISLYNDMGQLVCNLIDSKQELGHHIIKWDGKNNHGYLLGTGLYFAKFKTDEFFDVKKVLLLK